MATPDPTAPVPPPPRLERALSTRVAKAPDPSTYPLAALTRTWKPRTAAGPSSRPSPPQEPTSRAASTSESGAAGSKARPSDGSRAPLSSPERAVWRAAFCAIASSGLVRIDGRLSVAQAARLCADFGDCAAQEYRRRVMRSPR